MELLNCCKNTTVEQFYQFDNDSSLDGYYYLNNFDNFVSSQRESLGLSEPEISFTRGSSHLAKAELSRLAERVLFRGTRTKLSLKMYAEEVKAWLKQADERLQREILLSRLQQEQQVHNAEHQHPHERTFTI